MNEFTASNGWKLSRDGEMIFTPFGRIFPDDALALKELFQHERDEELGRWRWPENPEYVVYRFTCRNVRVLRESIGKYLDYMDDGYWPSNPSDYSSAARAYFDAHPEPKPWEDAQPNEAWVLTVDGEEYPWGVGTGVDAGRFVYLGGLSNIPLDHPSITDGRRIWPEEE